MLDNIKIQFTISELEDMTGISAHTIRMWERRYHLLDPQRTDTNIRRYSGEDFKKLLNIALLLGDGYKISEVAAMSDVELRQAVNASITTSDDFLYAIHDFKTAMLTFDTPLFEETYRRLSVSLSFEEIFLRVLVPFLDHIGSLWQTNTITVAHEHYVSNLLRQKLFFQIEHVPKSFIDTSSRYVLFLPLGELHELGLLFVYYTLLLSGRQAIYLGPDVDIAALQKIPKEIPHTYISYMTIAPGETALASYLQEFRKTLLRKDDQLLVTGFRIREFNKPGSWKNVHLFHQLADLLKHL